MNEAAPALYRHQSLSLEYQSEAVQYTGDNLAAIGRFAAGRAFLTQSATPTDNADLDAAITENQAEPILLLAQQPDRTLQRAAVGDYLVKSSPKPAAQADERSRPRPDVLWQVMSPSQYERRWQPPEHPQEPHSCADQNPEPPEARSHLMQALRYDGDNLDEITRLAGSWAVVLNALDPGENRNHPLITITTAYRDLLVILPGDWLLCGWNPAAGQLDPDDVDVLEDADFQEIYAPAG